MQHISLFRTSVQLQEMPLLDLNLVHAFETHQSQRIMPGTNVRISGLDNFDFVAQIQQPTR